MSSVPTNYAFMVAGIIFVIGAVGVMARRNLIFILMSIELMLGGAAVAFIAAASKWRQPDGQVFVIFILVTAAAEVAVGLSLLLRAYHSWKSVDADEADTMKG